VHGVALWAWDLPALFEAALSDSRWHPLQHGSFLLSALLFGWAPLGAASHRAQGPALIYLFTTMVHTGVLGGLLTLSPTVWYPSYMASASAWGLDRWRTNSPED